MLPSLETQHSDAGVSTAVLYRTVGAHHRVTASGAHGTGASGAAQIRHRHGIGARHGWGGAVVHHVAGRAAERIELRWWCGWSGVRQARVVVMVVVWVVVVVTLGRGCGGHGRGRRVGDGGGAAADVGAGHEVLRSDIADVGSRGGGVTHVGWPRKRELREESGTLSVRRRNSDAISKQVVRI